MRVPAASMMSLLLCLGCMTKETGILSHDVPFKVGEASFREVISMWGNPDSIKGDVAIWKVTTSNGSRIKAGYMMIGVTTSSQRLATREYRLSFDETDILRDVQICDSIPAGASWAILPW